MDCSIRVSLSSNSRLPPRAVRATYSDTAITATAASPDSQGTTRMPSRRLPAAA